MNRNLILLIAMSGKYFLGGFTAINIGYLTGSGNFLYRNLVMIIEEN